MLWRVDGFDWDSANREKCVRHGVSLAEVEAAFLGAIQIAPDLKHSDNEARYIAIGFDGQARPIFIAFTLRTISGVRRIRPISARYMHAKEIDRYDPSRS